MIRISDKTLCCGCTACVTACPAQCIVMRRDREGFDYPVANPDMCIGCGKCEAVCPVLNPLKQSEPKEAYAVRIEKNLQRSSSGGVFPAIAESIIGEGGVVFGAVVEENMNVGHVEAEDMAGVERMKGSKYVQSDLYSTFEDVKTRLEEGRKVLFTGTPCQVAGLHKYLGGYPEGLLTADCACHGVPSPGLWMKYVKSLEQQSGKSIRDIRFRDKFRGWRQYGMMITYDDGVQHFIGREKDLYLSLFMQDMTLRPSCYNCPARDGRSASDLTLSDLWSVQESAPGFNDDRGVSGVLVNTEKGRDMIGRLPQDCMIKIDEALAVKDNGGFAASVQRPQNRDEFFKGVHSATDLPTYMSGYVVKPSFLKRICRQLRTAASLMKRKLTK